VVFKFLTEDVKISKKKLIAVTILFSNTFACFYLYRLYFLNPVPADVGSYWSYIANFLFYSSVVVSAIVGSLISERVDRRKFLLTWLAFGAVATASLAIFQGLEFSLLSSVLIGISFGLGFPSCVAFLAESTTVEERGRVSGVVILITFVMMFAAILFSSLLNLGLVEIVLLSVIIKSISFLALIIDPCERSAAKKKSWKNILASKDFGSYLIPWLLFCIAYGLSLTVESGLPDTPAFQAYNTIGLVLQYIFSAAFALVAGIMADHFGRKQPIIVGLVMLGASYAFVGLATTPLSWGIYAALSGVAWGTLMVSLALTAIGDLAVHGSKERVFVLAIIIPLMTHVGFSSIPEVLSVYAPANILSSALSIVLFLSVIPIIRAAETLPENRIRSRQMRNYLNKMSKRFQKPANDTK
jgi:MFS family permease